MADWAELDSALNESSSSRSAKRRSRARTTTTGPDAATAAAAGEVTPTAPQTDATATAAASASTVEPVPAVAAWAPSPPATRVNAAPGGAIESAVERSSKSIGAVAASASSASSSNSNELERLRAENVALREQLTRQSPATQQQSLASSSQSRSSSRGPRLTERPKALVSFQRVSLRARKYLDAIMRHAEVDSASSDSSSDDEREPETMDTLLARATVGGVSAGTDRASVQYFETFCLDRCGQRRLRRDMFQPLDYQLFDVPTYEGPINVVPLPPARTDAGDLDIASMLASCFNCGAAHQMRECTLPRDEGCIRLNSMLFREYAQGRRKDGERHTEPRGGGGASGGGGGGGGGGFQGRYYEEESLKTEVGAGIKKMEEDGEAEAKTTHPGEYFMHAIHPSITHPSVGDLLRTLPKSDLQVIDRDEDQLVLPPTAAASESPTNAPLAPATPSKPTSASPHVAAATGAATSSTSGAKRPADTTQGDRGDPDRIVIDSESDDDGAAAASSSHPSKRHKANHPSSTPARSAPPTNNATAPASYSLPTPSPYTPTRPAVATSSQYQHQPQQHPSSSYPSSSSSAGYVSTRTPEASGGGRGPVWTSMSPHAPPVPPPFPPQAQGMAGPPAAVGVSTAFPPSAHHAYYPPPQQPYAGQGGYGSQPPPPPPPPQMMQAYAPHAYPQQSAYQQAMYPAYGYPPVVHQQPAYAAASSYPPAPQAYAYPPPPTAPYPPQHGMPLPPLGAAMPYQPQSLPRPPPPPQQSTCTDF